MPSFRNHTSVSGALQGVVVLGAAIASMFGGMTCKAVAGDLLRQGYSSTAGGTVGPGSFTPPSVAKARQNAKDVLARTTQAVAAMNAMQTAARALAQAGPNNLGPNPNVPGTTLPNVPDGLALGGLNPLQGITKLAAGGYSVAGWTGVSSLNQTVTSSQTTVNVGQDLPDAELYWTTFNIGKKTTLAIDQSKTGATAANSIAFNIIEDPSLAPSQILGSIRAPGQVYVINQNGIIFGGSSQVNVHTLVASSLPIDSYYITNGLINDPAFQFLFSAIPQTSTSGTPPSFTPPTYHTGADGDVTVQPGAVLESPADASSVGGRVALIGPNVSNGGTISTPDGQTILAAGLQVGLAASTDPTLRGLDVYIGAVSDSAQTAGKATNSGIITAPGGDTYMTGATVKQLGVIASLTTVSLNGRIDLNADYNATSIPGTGFDFQSTGTVLLGNGSVTQILPDWTSDTTITPGLFSLYSQVNIQGLAIHLAGDATIFAPDAQGTNGAAGVVLDAGTWNYFQNGNNISDGFANSAPSQIYLDSGATIDVQGSWDISAAVTQNIIPVQLLGPELADSPLQRTGPLAGQTIFVDVRDSGVYDGQVWYGTPLIDDVQAFINLIPYTVGELTIGGGSVALTAGGSVVMQQGSQVNVSSGWIDYQGGVVQTSEVISGGHVFPINEATPALVYQGFNLGTFTVDHPKYAISQIYTDPILDLSHYEDSYVQGASSGGSLSITAPATALEGELQGLTVAGPRQLANLPTPSQFNLTYQTQYVGFETGAVTVAAPVAPNIVFSNNNNLGAPAPFSEDGSGNPAGLTTAEEENVVLPPALVGADGFGAVNIAIDFGNNIGSPAKDVGGTITVPAGVALDAVPDGSITLTAGNINIQGSVTAPGGSLSFSSYDYDPLLPGSSYNSTPDRDPNRGNFTLGAAATLNAAGLNVDNRPNVPGADTEAQVTAGGKIGIAGLTVNLEQGSTINVSGGILMPTSGVASYGKGGSITIKGGSDPAIASISGGSLNLGSSLSGYSGGKGGSLTISTQLIQVGGSALDPSTLLLSPAFFSEGGFTSFNLTGVGAANSGGYVPGIDIAPGVKIDPVVTSMVVDPETEGANLTSTLTVLPVGQRPPVNLSFSATGLNDSAKGTFLVRGDVVMGAGSVIETDPLGSVAFNGQTTTILGSVYAPGGSISISGAAVAPQGSAYLPTVEIGPQSVLSTAGVLVPTPNAQGYTTGNVLNGGTITISGNIVAEAGAVINVSGATAVLDVSPLALNENLDGFASANSPLRIQENGTLRGGLLVPMEVDSNGGTISLNAGEDFFTNATLLGQAGGPSAIGGTVILSAGANDSSIPPNTPTLTITQANQPFSSEGKTPILNTVYNSKGQAFAVPQGYFGAESFLDGGFSTLVLNGSVSFDGPVDIQSNGSLIIGRGGLIVANQRVTLQAPYVALGGAFIPPIAPGQTEPPFVNGIAVPPYNGTGQLDVIANLIDVGNLSLGGIGDARLIASNGSIRGDGTLDIQGNLTMQAGQIYPATEVTFQIDAYDTTGNVQVASSTLGGDTVTLSVAAPAGFGAGSTLLGSTVKSIQGTSVTLNSGASVTITAPTAEGFVAPGTVTFKGGTPQDTPLSAGGTINVYASVINQGGVLRAPAGYINLGWDGSGTGPTDPITNGSVDAAQTITLAAGSVTSVSEIDSLTNQPLEIPYGINYNGTDWVDPAGTDITTGGVPAKEITISAGTIADEKGAVIDIRGGGDLMAYQFVPGLQGNNDPLASTSSFAIIPGYQLQYAPYGAFNLNLPNNDFNGDPGYTNPNLAVGEQVYLNGQGALSAGLYTLLPARYALLPGAYLVTPNSSSAVVNQTLPDGTYLVSGYQTNAYQTGRTAQPLFTSFQIEPSKVVNNDAQYTVVLANQFLATSAVANNAPVPRLPQDAGQLVFTATQGLSVQGTLEAESVAGGLGGLVDISSPDNIIIGGPTTVSAAPNTLVLDASELSSFGAASLLIGGNRDITGNDATVTAATASITVDNAGDPLTGQDIILVSSDAITLDPNSEIFSSGGATGAEDLTITGNGTLVRVSSDPSATASRIVSATTSPAELSIDAGAQIRGGSATLDSSGGTYLDPTASIEVKSIALHSGEIAIEFANAGPNAPAPSASSGLILAGTLLPNLFNSAQTISLLSYSSLDLYGGGTLGATNAGGLATLQNLTLSAGSINGNGGDVQFNAQNITLENQTDATATPGATTSSGGALTFNADRINLGSYELTVNQFDSVNLNAANEVVATAQAAVAPGAASTAAQIGPGLAVQGNLTITTPVIYGNAGAAEAISATAYSGGPAGASGDLVLAAPATASTTVPDTSALGAKLTFTGATGLTDNTAITAHSGSVTLEASSGALNIGNGATASIDVSGEGRTFFDQTEYTNGGQVNLIADRGLVDIGAKSTVNVGYGTTVVAGGAGGNAGTLTINAPEGSATLLGSLMGEGGAGEEGGSFSLTAGSIPSVTYNNQMYAQGSLDPINAILNAGGFTQSITISDENDSSVTIGSAGAASEPTVIAENYNVSADGGSITVYGTINAANVASLDPNGNPIEIGGAITLQAQGSVNIASGATLTVAGQNYDNAGEGGSVALEAGSDVNGVASSTGYVNIAQGSTIDLSVAATPMVGDQGGTLLLRAPQIGSQSSPTGVQIGAIDGTIIGSANTAAPSTITVEGYSIFNAGTDGSQGIIDNEEGNVAANGLAFGGNTGSFSVSGNSVTGSGIEGGLLSGDVSLPNGNVTLANAITGGNVRLLVEPGAEIINNSSSVNGGSLELQNTWNLTSDRFGNNLPGILTLRALNNVIFDYNNGTNLGASLTDGFSNGTYSGTPIAGSSWSYQITAGADFTSADIAAVQSAVDLTLLTPLQTANNAESAGSVLLGNGAPALLTTKPANLKNYLIEYFQTIRTGNGNISISAAQDVQILNSLATIYTAGVKAPAAPFTFSTPVGSSQNLVATYATQYTYEGGNVVIAAQNDIEHLILDANTGDLLPDSSLEMPTSWLERRGNLSSTGVSVDSGSWWVNFENFFEGVGALGGGNVTLAAGNDINNVDAAVPTNARVSEDNTMSQELGGGDLTVKAGNDINAGVYYVERGQGRLAAGGSIVTNYTRTDDTENAIQGAGGAANTDPQSWLPTTLFDGVGSFNVSAGGSIDLGQVANPFLLPQSIFNGTLTTNPATNNKSYFSTYGANDAIAVSSLTGDVTIQGGPSQGTAPGGSSLYLWYEDVYSTQPGGAPSYGSSSQQWLQINQTIPATTNSVTGIVPLFALMPPSLRVTSFSGSIDLQEGLNLAPSPTGTLDLIAADAINGLQPTGNNGDAVTWTESYINVSDADPASIPSILSPLGNPINFQTFDEIFSPSGSLEGSYATSQTQQELHKKGLLHAMDTVPNRLYAASGDITGLTLYSPKVTRAIAGLDITDVAFYIQNDNGADISVVSAGRDLIPYDPNSALRQEAQSAGNELSAVAYGEDDPGTTDPNAGDIQIAGPGTIEILAGRNVTAGVSQNNGDGTAVGFTSIGNEANPYLPASGAQIILAAGLGSVADGLEASSLDFQAFADKVLSGPDAATYFSDLASSEAGLDVPDYGAYKKLSKAKQATVGLDLFYLVLRDAGRDHNLFGNPGYGAYTAGDAAIRALLPHVGTTGDINLTSKELTTERGGDIDVLDPSGQMTVGVNLAGAQPVEQGIFTDDGGNVSIYTRQSVNLGTSRIFTLQGGNVIIWSDQGNIDAGNSSKTVQSAPPTRVVVDPQSANVETDLSGLATGGGIGVLATIAGVPPGNVDLIAPTGVIDAGNAGIRATGNLNLAAVQVLNASNIQAGGATTGAPSVAVAAPNLAGLSAASSAAGAGDQAANQQTEAGGGNQNNQQTGDSVITVSVVGYGGGDSEDSTGG